jgi:hypothetical protein
LQPPCSSLRSHPGPLIAIDGDSRNGKSVPLGMLAARYPGAGERVVEVAWNSDADISPLTARHELSLMMSRCPLTGGLRLRLDVLLCCLKLSLPALGHPTRWCGELAYL